MVGKLILEDGTEISGTSFGHLEGVSGEVVFATGMTGYPQAFTDPSFYGQILVMTYPLVGNYGVPDKKLWESNKLQISGLIVSDYINTPSHFESKNTLSEWLIKEKVPALEIKDTRFLTQYLRNKGTMLGKIKFGKPVEDFDPNSINLVEKVSLKKVSKSGNGNPTASSGRGKTIVLIDCGAKRNITRCFLERGVKVITVPWDFDPFAKGVGFDFDALFVSNGPGDPKKVTKTIATIKKSLENKIPTLGICLGNQLLALAAGGDTYKLKYGHRSQNQPCLLEKSNRCYITTQNHGFAIGEIPGDFNPWFVNANDQSIEGIIHKSLPFMSVQFHPEATPGPKDTEWIFDYFLEKL
ncbi:MAG TPA: glutamine-hydrolyzing carbamoyl-phosphate synthase small subunit [Candidatus Limnocylindrales bacterium]|nr:glutamine-hydrolyzing carbamoyl-phosphate synthase small subunit [Candidatus Limnocylindrales bacterium]